MSTLPSDSVTAITVNYNAGDIPDNDIQQFKSELQEFGYTRLRGYRGPAAGIGFEFWVLIEFVGLAAASGIIGHLAVQFFNKLATKVLSFMKTPTDPRRPCAVSIKLSYDDLDIDIRYIDDKILKKLSRIINDIINEINNGGLKEAKANNIIMPMEIRDGKWEPFFVQDPSGIYNYPFQFWKVSSHDIGGLFGIYDFMSKKFVELENKT